MTTRTPCKDSPAQKIVEHVGKRIRQRRLGLRISQAALGDKMGITFQQQQKYENGANRIGSGNLYLTARALGVTVDYFYQGIDLETDAPQTATADGPDFNDRQNIKLVAACEGLHKKDKNLLIKMAKRIPKAESTNPTWEAPQPGQRVTENDYADGHNFIA